MSCLAFVRCVCGTKPVCTFDFINHNFLIQCPNSKCKYRLKSKSDNMAVAIINWRSLVDFGKKHQTSAANNSEELKRICAGGGRNDGNGSSQLDAHSFLEASLKPDPESGFGARADSNPDPRRIDFENPAVLEDFRAFMNGASEGPIGIPQPRNPMVAFIRGIGGHASGGGGPC